MKFVDYILGENKDNHDIAIFRVDDGYMIYVARSGDYSLYGKPKKFRSIYEIFDWINLFEGKSFEDKVKFIIDNWENLDYEQS